MEIDLQSANTMLEEVKSSKGMLLICNNIFSSTATTSVQKFKRIQVRANEPLCMSACLWGFGPGQTQPRLYSHRKWPDEGNLGF